MNEAGVPSEPVVVEIGAHSDAAIAAFVTDAYTAHESSIHGLLFAVAGDREVAADATQEAFLRLLREARAGRIPDHPGAWLYRAGANLIISRARRAATARRFAPRLVAREGTGDPERAALEHERSADMRQVLLSLSPIERMALVMAAQGLAGEEIARHLGKSHAATRTLMSRARMRLRQELAAQEAER
jgi:RNA polymerase sigma-70 factor (ECF subfamily)